MKIELFNHLIAVNPSPAHCRRNDIAAKYTKARTYERTHNARTHTRNPIRARDGYSLFVGHGWNKLHHLSEEIAPLGAMGVLLQSLDIIVS